MLKERTKVGVLASNANALCTALQGHPPPLLRTLLLSWVLLSVLSVVCYAAMRCCVVLTVGRGDSVAEAGASRKPVGSQGLLSFFGT